MSEVSDLVHAALFYTDPGDFLAGTRRFVETGLEAGEPVLIAVPRAKIEPMLSGLSSRSAEIEFINMNDLGRNPGRIIPTVRDWIDRHANRRCRFIGEPIWPARSPVEAVEATRHEALINLAFADAAATILWRASDLEGSGACRLRNRGPGTDRGSTRGSEKSQPRWERRSRTVVD
jgi:hypothetical protein